MRFAPPPPSCFNYLRGRVCFLSAEPRPTAAAATAGTGVYETPLQYPPFQEATAPAASVWLFGTPSACFLAGTSNRACPTRSATGLDISRESTPPTEAPCCEGPANRKQTTDLRVLGKRREQEEPPRYRSVSLSACAAGGLKSVKTAEETSSRGTSHFEVFRSRQSSKFLLVR